YGAIVPTLARDPQVIPCFPLLAMQPYYYFTIILTSTGYYELPSRVAHILHRLMALPAHYPSRSSEHSSASVRLLTDLSLSACYASCSCQRSSTVPTCTQQ